MNSGNIYILVVYLICCGFFSKKFVFQENSCSFLWHFSHEWVKLLCYFFLIDNFFKVLVEALFCNWGSLIAISRLE